MRRLIAFSAIVVLCVAGAADLSACGEKFFFAGRLVKWADAMKAPVPGTLLVYTNPASNLPVALQQTRLDQYLKKAGHKVDVVADAAKVEAALKTGRYDVLLVSPGDMAQATRWQTNASAITISSVLYKPTKEVRQAAGRAVDAEKLNEAIVLVNNLVKARPRARTTP